MRNMRRMCVEIWQVLITLAGKKREVTLTKEKPRDRKLRNANSPLCYCQCIHTQDCQQQIQNKIEPNNFLLSSETVAMDWDIQMRT